METAEKSCNNLPTSLAYMDTSTSSHKLLRHVIIEENDEFKNIGKYNAFDLG